MLSSLILPPALLMASLFLFDLESDHKAKADPLETLKGKAKLASSKLS